MVHQILLLLAFCGIALADFHITQQLGDCTAGDQEESALPELFNFKNVIVDIAKQEFTGTLTLEEEISNPLEVKYTYAETDNDQLSDSYDADRGNVCLSMGFNEGPERNFVQRILLSRPNVLCVPPLEPGQFNMDGVTLNQDAFRDFEQGYQYVIEISFTTEKAHTCVKIEGEIV